KATGYGRTERPEKNVAIIGCRGRGPPRRRSWPPQHRHILAQTLALGLHTPAAHRLPRRPQLVRDRNHLRRPRGVLLPMPLTRLTARVRPSSTLTRRGR